MTGEIYYNFRDKTTFTSTSATGFSFTLTDAAYSDLLEIINAGKYVYMTLPTPEHLSCPCWQPVQIGFNRQNNPPLLTVAFPYYDSVDIVWAKVSINTATRAGTVTF